MSAAVLAVVIKFVGICLFTKKDYGPSNQQLMTSRPTTINSGNTGGTEFVAILPKIRQPPSQVEPHIAFIAFDACKYRGSTGWTVKNFGNGQLYIELKGEMIHFAPSGPSAPNAQVTSTSNVNLPYVTSLHNGQTTLLPAFQPPYSGAAAVVEMPVGATTACATGTRVDTEVTLNTHDVLVIFGTNGSLAVADDTNLTIGNMPASMFPNGHPATTSALHYVAYCEMTTDPTNCPLPASPNVSPCTSSGFPLAVARMRSHSTSAHLKRQNPSSASAGFECSNNQFP